MKDYLFIVRGLPGSGKSSLVKRLLSLYDDTSVHYEADDYWVKNGSYDFNTKFLAKAHEECFDNVTSSMQRRVTNIFVSNTFTTEREINIYLELAKKYNYNTFVIIVENRNETESIHNVPKETLEKMHNRFNIKLISDNYGV